MKYSRIPALITAMLLLAACANTRIENGCRSMIGTEYERCVRNNETSEQAVQDRAKEKRASKPSSGEFDKGDIQSAKDQ